MAIKTKNERRKEKDIRKINSADLKNKRMKNDLKKTKKEKKKDGILSSVLPSFFGDKDEKITSQDTVDIKVMYKDGICELEDGKFSKMIQFYDINYQLAQNEDKQYIFEGYCDFLNYFDSTVEFQLYFLNKKTALTDQIHSLKIKGKNDGFNVIREEYSDMLTNQLAKGNNGIVKTKYIVFSIKAENYDAAKVRLERIETDILNNFKVLGANARPLTGAERVKITAEILNDKCPDFEWKDLVKKGVSVKDLIAPSSFNFLNPNYVRYGKNIGQVSMVNILASEMSDRMLADLLDLESDIIVSYHVKAIDQMEATKTIKRLITNINAMKIDEQKKAVRAGYDMDIIPSDLNTYAQEAENLLNDIQSRNERMFLVTMLICNLSENKKELDENVYQTKGICNKYNCVMRELSYQQEDGINACLPFNNNKLFLNRQLTTSSLAIFIPFTTQELFMRNGLYYGLNAISNNMIMVDRKELHAPNGLILGTPGSGKSFSAKREITNVFLSTSDDIMILDPEGEYLPLVLALGGTEVKVAQGSEQHLNPLDINLNYGEDDNPIDLKSDFILSMMELILGGTQGLSPKEKSIIDRCVRRIYLKFLETEDPDDMPILTDLYDALKEQKEDEAQQMAVALEIYVHGSMNVFNNKTNVDLSNRVVCFNIKELGKQLTKLGMLVVQDQVWNRVTVNRSDRKTTRFYIDEFHLLLKDKQTSAFSVEIWKRFRKWGGIPTGITQNVKDILQSEEISNILENSDFIYMLNQGASDREILAERLNISKHQLSYVTNSSQGEGLLIFGSVILPFIDRFPQDTKLYKLMTTKLEEVSY